MRKGFTLIEIMVVVAVTALLTSVMIGYSGRGRTQLTLELEAQKIANFILEAKALAVATYVQDPGNPEAMICGYGVRVNYTERTYSIFRYQPPPGGDFNLPPCADIGRTDDQNQIFSAYRHYIASSTIADGLVFGSPPNPPASERLTVVLFVRPAPRTVTSNLADTGLGAAITNNGKKVVIRTADGALTRTIEVNLAGQVNF